MDRYPDNLFEEIRRLTARIDALEAQLRQRPGVTQASQGWLLSDMSIPSVAAGQCQIGCEGGEFYAATSGGVKRMFDQMINVPHSPPMTAAETAPGSYSPAHSTALRLDIFNLRATLASQMQAERDSGQQANS